MRDSVLVVGCGFLGRRAARRWRAAGRTVSALTRSDERSEQFRAEGIEPILGDVTEPASLRFPQSDTVLYAVGLDRTAGQSMREVYVGGLANVLGGLPRPRCFIYVSSTSVYGQTDGEEVDETAATDPEEESGKIVLEAERLLRERMPEAIILRFAGIYGPGRLLRRRSIESGEVIVGDPERWLNLIHVEDGVMAVLAAAERGRPGEVYNVSDGQPVRRREFYTSLARLLKAPKPRFVPPPTDAPLPPHERAHRRIVSRRLRDDLAVTLRYPDHDSGLAASLA
jgi:nucleoside-diphosphate-sugar epimerase